MSTSKKRQLAAILFADIAGYTALMQKDEQSASVLLRRFQKNIEELIPKNNGQIINFYGDGALCIFNNPLEAVRCAMQLQNIFSENPKVPVRLGLHMGTVVFENKKIYGDSVNIASRIESMGVPGTVLFSKKIRDEIKNQPDIKIKSLGKFSFKNVEEEMEVFALANEGFIVPNKEELKGKLKDNKKRENNFPKIAAAVFSLLIIAFAFYFFSNKNKTTANVNSPNAIAIFPFDVKGSDEIKYLGDGMVDLISTQLDEMPGINSIDPNLLFSRLKEKSAVLRDPETAAEISTSFNAGQFILGNILELDGVLKISASKYNVDGEIISKINVEGKKEGQLAEVIDDLTRQLIAKEMESRGQEFTSLGAITSNNMESLKAYLKGEQAYRDGNYKQSLTHFQEAVQLDSTFAMAWMRVADAATWDLETFFPEARRNLLKYKYKLPKKWQEYYDAYQLYLKGRPNTADAFKKLIRKYGESREFNNGLAEFYFHFNPMYGKSKLEAKPYLIKNLQLEPGNVETFFHLSDCAVMEDDSATLQQMMSKVKKTSESYPQIQIKVLMLQDSVSDEEIQELVSHPHFRSEFIFSTFLPIKGKVINYQFPKRILKYFPGKGF